MILKLRSVIRASVTDGSNTMTSLVGDLSNGKTRIKQIENAVYLSGRQLLHNELGGKNEVVSDPVSLNILYHMILFAFICNNQQSHVICITSILKKSVQQNCSNEWLNCIM